MAEVPDSDRDRFQSGEVDMGVRFLRLGAPAREYFETGEAASGEAASGDAMDAERVEAAESEETAAPPIVADARSEMEQWSQYNQGDHYEPDPVAPPTASTGVSLGPVPEEPDPVSAASQASDEAARQLGARAKAAAFPRDLLDADPGIL
eukprot:3374800-Alexandrium_andersonii.AAC.1